MCPCLSEIGMAQPNMKSCTVTREILEMDFPSCCLFGLQFPGDLYTLIQWHPAHMHVVVYHVGFYYFIITALQVGRRLISRH